MEVMLPLSSTSLEFHFDGTEATPYNTAPSSPRLIGEPFDYQYHYTSAPTSPTRAAAIYSHFSSGWDNTLLSPRGGGEGTGDMFDFAFDSGRRSEISTADELFDNGRIRPMQPPSTPTAAPRSGERGRERISIAAARGSRARDTRSLSPLRDDHDFFNKNAASAAAAVPPTAYVKSVGESRKWSLKDLLLFRSASEGRATERDPLRKYSLFSFSPFSSSAATTSAASKKKGGDQDSMSGSFRSTDGSAGSVRRGGGGGGGGAAASAHKMHYTANRAAAEELRKKTPLAYQRQGLFSCMQFNPAIRSITKGFRGG